MTLRDTHHSRRDPGGSVLTAHRVGNGLGERMRADTIPIWGWVTRLPGPRFAGKDPA